MSCDVLSEASNVATAIGPFLTLLVLVQTIRVSRQVHRAQMLTALHQAYRESWTDRPPSPDDDWHKRFWERQAQQFEHWQEGDIATETYERWMNLRRVDFERNKSIGGKHFRDGLDEFIAEGRGAPFCRFMELVTRGDLQKAMKDWRPRVVFGRKKHTKQWNAV